MGRIMLLSGLTLVWACMLASSPAEASPGRPDAAEARTWRPTAAWGTQEAAQHSSPPGALDQAVPDLFRSSLQVVAALLCVLACFGVGVVLVRRYVGGSGAVGRAACVRILATGYLGHRRAIYVVDVLGRILVLGVTPTSITFLTSLEDREALERLFRETNRLPGVSFIGHCLERLWQKGGFGDGAKHSSSADQEKRERL